MQAELDAAQNMEIPDDDDFWNCSAQIGLDFGYSEMCTLGSLVLPQLILALNNLPFPIEIAYATIVPDHSCI